ncbi:MAG: hypothetical protein M3490_01400, partial [Chloroflexota bacterium]|nr:hypothetical protein [Chloroflexota bacterium]
MPCLDWSVATCQSFRNEPQAGGGSGSGISATLDVPEQQFRVVRCGEEDRYAARWPLTLPAG